MMIGAAGENFGCGLQFLLSFPSEYSTLEALSVIFGSKSKKLFLALRARENFSYPEHLFQISLRVRK